MISSVAQLGLCQQIITIAGFDFWTSDSIQTESSRKYDAESFARLAELGGWHVSELWSDGLIDAMCAKGV